MTVNIGNIQQRVTKIGGRKHYPWLDLIRFIAAFAVMALSARCAHRAPPPKGEAREKLTAASWLSLWESWHGAAVTERALDNEHSQNIYVWGR